MSVVYLRPTMVADPRSGGALVREDWSDPQRIPAEGAFVLSADTDSTSDGSNETTSQSWTLYVPVGVAEPDSSDRVDFDGAVFVQDGRAVRERNPFTGWAPYAQVRLIRTGA
jgi:hypothetical protein